MVGNGHRTIARVHDIAGINAECAMDSRVEIRHADGSLQDLRADLIGDANRLPRTQPATRQHHAECLGLMSASAAAVELRRPSEFGGNHHQRRIQQFILLQILQQRGECLIQILNQQMLFYLAVVVCIPAASVQEIQVERDFDKSHAGLHQPPR